VVKLLEKMLLAMVSRGNQIRLNVDRLPWLTGPLRLEDIGISKRISHRAQQIATIPTEPLERWLTEQCAKGLEPTLRGAVRLAKSLESSDSGAGPSKSGKGKKKNRNPPRKKPNTDNDRPVPPDSPLATVLEGLEHLKTLGRQLEPLYEMPDSPLEDVELKTIQRYFREIFKSLTELESYHRKQTNPYSPNDPHGGAPPQMIFSGGFAKPKRS
jgi:hypothetical protein